VLSIRFVRDAARDDYDTIGYLAFDSPRANAFKDLPEIFDFTDRTEEYKSALNSTAAFHLGASYADAFATVMHGFYAPLMTGGLHAPNIELRFDPHAALPEPTSLLHVQVIRSNNDGSEQRVIVLSRELVEAGQRATQADTHASKEDTRASE